MTTTITHATGTIVPTAVEGYRSERLARTVIGEVLDRADPDVTLRQFGLRTGSFRLVFAAEAAARAAEAALSVPQILAITNPDVAALSLSFVIADGSLNLEQDSDTPTLWRLIVPFQEVTP